MTQSSPNGHPGLDRTAGLAGIVCYGIVGVLPIVTGLDMGRGWWVLWAVGLPVFGAAVLVDLSRRVALVLLAPMLLLATAMYVLEPRYGFGAVPMVIVAACAGLLLPVLPAMGVVAAQSAVLVLVGLDQQDEAALVGSVFFLGLQVFAVMTGQIARREIIAGRELARVHAELRDAHAELRRTHAELGAAHAELEAAQARLAETSRTDERLRISRDLHDLVGHQLSALAVNLEVASHLAEGQAAEPVGQARTLAKELLVDVRDVVSRLRDPHTELRVALKDMAAAIPRPAVHLEVADDLPPLGTGPVEALVRCVQEMLTNAVRHSGAENVWVAVDHNAGRVRVTTRDDGRGATEVTPGNGLTGMRERVEGLGGTLEVDGSAGFRVDVAIPTGALG